MCAQVEGSHPASALSSAFGPHRAASLAGCQAPGRDNRAVGGSRSPHSCGCGSSPLSRPSPLGGGKWRVGVTECACPRPLLPQQESAIKAPLPPALHTPSASSRPSGRHAGQQSPHRPPARRRECRCPLALTLRSRGGQRSRTCPGRRPTLPVAVGRWEGGAPFSNPWPPARSSPRPKARLPLSAAKSHLPLRVLSDFTPALLPDPPGWAVFWVIFWRTRPPTQGSWQLCQGSPLAGRFPRRPLRDRSRELGPAPFPRILGVRPETH